MVGSIALLSNAHDLPNKLKPSTIERWLAGGQTAYKIQYEYVMQRYKNLPNNCTNTKRPIKSAPNRVNATPAMREELRKLHGQAPLKYLDNAPCRFNNIKLAHVLSGRDKTIPRDFVEYLIAQANTPASDRNVISKPCPPDLHLAELPKEPPTRREPVRSRSNKYANVEYAPITDEIYHQLHHEVRRTLVIHSQMVKTRKDAPKGLSAQMLRQRLNGKTRSAEKHYLDYVLNAYAALPDAPPE